MDLKGQTGRWGQTGQLTFHAQRMGIGWFVTGLVTGKQGDICESDLSHMGRLVLGRKLFFPEHKRVGGFQGSGKIQHCRLE